MNLLPKHNGHTASEYDMQEEVAARCKRLVFRMDTTKNGSWDINRITPKVYREIRIPQIHRISDIIVKVTPRKVYNIECKISDYGGVLEQAKDHLQWADYSYICIHDKAYLPEYWIKFLMQDGIGLLMWKKGTVMEVIGARPSGSKDKEIRAAVMKTLAGKDRRPMTRTKKNPPH